MSILDKHPMPWRILDCDEETDDPLNLASGYQPRSGDVVDASGSIVVFAPDIDDEDAFGSPWARRLMMAAPELLAALKRVEDYGRLDEDARDLIARLDGDESA